MMYSPAATLRPKTLTSQGNVFFLTGEGVHSPHRGEFFSSLYTGGGGSDGEQVGWAFRKSFQVGHGRLFPKLLEIKSKTMEKHLDEERASLNGDALGWQLESSPI